MFKVNQQCPPSFSKPYNVDSSGKRTEDKHSTKETPEEKVETQKDHVDETSVLDSTAGWHLKHLGENERIRKPTPVRDVFKRLGNFALNTADLTMRGMCVVMPVASAVIAYVWNTPILESSLIGLGMSIPGVVLTGAYLNTQGDVSRFKQTNLQYAREHYHDYDPPNFGKPISGEKAAKRLKKNKTVKIWNSDRMKFDKVKNVKEANEYFSPKYC